MAKKQSDPVVGAWRKSLHCLIHPGLPVLATLREMVGRLDAVKNFLDTLDPTDKEQARRGVAVGALAVAYADRLLTHFQLWDDDPAPPPASVPQARLVVGNVLAFVGAQLQAGTTARPSDDEGEEPPLEVATMPLRPGAEQPYLTVPASAVEMPVGPTARAAEEASGGLVVDRGTFAVRWRGKTCGLGHTKEFLLIEYLHRKAGRFVPTIDLMEEVWEGDTPEQNTIQKTVSNLRRKLKDAGMGDLTIKPERGHYALILP